MNRTEKQNDTRFESRYKKFRLYKFIALTCLVVFILGGLVIFEDDITVENIRYLVKYINFESGLYNISDESTIYYDSDSSNNFSVFKGDLAVVNNGGVTLYNANGDVTLADSFSMSNPIACTGNRYFAVYDLGGYYLRIYNSFSLLYEENFSYPIQSVSMNDSGYFCVCTTEKSYHSAVLVYNNSFEQIYRWLSSDKFVTEAVLDNYNSLFVSAIRVEEGSLIGEVLQFDIGKDAPLYTHSYSEALPLSLKSQKRKTLFLNDSSLSLLSQGEVEASYAFSSETLDMAAIGEKYSAIALNKILVGVNFELVILDEKCQKVNSLPFSVPILDMKAYDDFIFVLTRNEIYLIHNGTDVKSFEIKGDYSSFEVFNSNTIVLCGDDSAGVFLYE